LSHSALVSLSLLSHDAKFLIDDLAALAAEPRFECWAGILYILDRESGPKRWHRDSGGLLPSDQDNSRLPRVV